MDIAFDLLKTYQTELLILAGGTVGSPVIGAVLIKTLRLPLIRTLVRGFFVSAGVWFSLSLSKIFPKLGEKLEDEILEFIKTTVYDGFAAGANRDDKRENNAAPA